jgi:glycosyltransferase involved in cell wall biosynthesis
MISVIIPVHNGAAFIAAAIASVMRQSCPPAEILVVDDGSTDESADIANSFGQRVIVRRRKHNGVAAALNAGIAESRSELLAFIDADDLWAPDKLAKQSAALACKPSLDAIFGQVVRFTDMSCQISAPDEIRQMSESVAGICKTAMLIRRASFNRIGAFDPALVADFPEWYARAVRMGIRTELLDQVVAFRRIHRNNTTRCRREALTRDYLKIARALVSGMRPPVRGRT